ncbi:TonB-dependent receptor [Sphingomonas natans]|nr:TonB-dependent receptor [Sphingomonas sp. BIUV-7]
MRKLLCGTTALTCLVSTVAPAVGQTKAFDVPAQPIAPGLVQIGKQADVQILVARDVSANKRGNAVRGSMTVPVAIERFTKGAGLTARQMGEHTYAVVAARAGSTGQEVPATVPLRPVQASSEPMPPASPAAAASAEEAGTDIVITGFRQSYIDALRMKRDDLGVSDSISSDGLGRFPDLNVGEALQRIPGVQINREAASRDATINLRGLPGTYARYTINGQAFADPVLDGATPLGAFNADVFSAIAVRKTISATDQAGGLSGIVDLQIQPALSRKDGGFFKLAGEYDTLGKYKTPAATIGYNKHLTSNLAVFGVVAYKKERFRRDSIFFNAYSPLSPTTTPGFASFADYYAPFNSNGTCPSGQVCAATGTGAKGKTGVLYASDQRQAVKFNEGSLLTAAGGAEWKPTDELRIGATGFYTRRNLKNNFTNLMELDMRSTRAIISPTTPVVVQDDGNAYVQGFNFANVQINDSIRSQPLLEQMWDVIGTAEWKHDDWRITGTLTNSRGENNSVETQLDVRNLPTVAGNGANGAFNSGGGDIGNYLLTLNRNPAVIVPSGPFTWSAANQPTQVAANGDQIIVAGSSAYGVNKTKAAQGEIERKFELPLLSGITLGARYQQDRYISQGYRTSAKGVQTQNIDSKFLGDNPYTSSFFGGNGGDYLTNWPQLDYDYIVSRLQPVTTSPGDVVTPTGWINDPTNSAYSLYNFGARRNIFAAYAQAQLGFEIFNIPIKGYAGVHYEQTHQLINALSQQVTSTGATAFVPTQFRQNYHDFLPSVFLAANLTSKLVLRGGYNKAFVRPVVRTLTPTTTVSPNSTGYAIQYGGSDLKPYYATSEDASIEWYNRPGGLVSLAFYRKVITNLIAAENRLDRLCPADASSLGLGRLTTVGTTCFSNLLVAGNPAIITASGNYNQPNPITVTGLEFTVQQNFDFLPGLLKNLGGQFNYSYTHISGTNSNGSKAILPGVSKNNVNLIGYYESPKIGFRVVYTWRDEYSLTGANSFTGGNSFVATRGQVDSSLSFKFSDQYSLSLDAFNLNDAKRVQYQVVQGIPRQVDYDGRTFTLSFHGTF